MRKKYIDCAKGICIGLVVLGHICRRNWGGTFPVVLIYTVNVQTFYIISGMLLEERKEYEKSWKDILVSNLLRLLIPYFTFETLYNLTYSVFNGFSTFRWQEIDTLIFYGRGIATWFLPALFIAKIIVVFVRKSGKTIFTTIIMAGILFGLGLFHKFLFPWQNVWQARFIFRAFIGTGFLIIGMLLPRIINAGLPDIKIGVALFVSYLIMAVINGQVSTYLLELNNPLLYVASSVSGSIVLLSVCRLFSSSVLEYWGQNSIVILGTHQIILYVFFSFLGRDYSVQMALIIWSVTMLLEYPIIEGINRFAPFLIGKKRYKTS